MLGVLFGLYVLQSDGVDTVLETDPASRTCSKDPDVFKVSAVHVQSVCYLFHKHTCVVSRCAELEVDHQSSHLSQMPPGSFSETCSNCSLDYHILVCTCLREVDPLISLYSQSNLTGEWTSGGNFSSTDDTFLFSQPSLHTINTINVTDNSIAYQITCFDGGRNGPETCSPKFVTQGGEYLPWTYWHSANITVSPGNTTMRLDNGSVLDGTIATDFNSIKWSYRNISSLSDTDLPDPVVWVRRISDETGIRTSMSLKSCERVPMPSGNTGFNVTNENGYLTCDWTNKPPPRVGPYVRSLQGRWAIKRNCKAIASCE